MSTVRLDTDYFGRKLGLITRDLSHYTPQEMARELVRLAKVADESEAVKEAQPVAAIPEATGDVMRVDKSRMRLCATCVHEPVAGDTFPCNCCWNPVGDMYCRKPGAAPQPPASLPAIPEAGQSVPKLTDAQCSRIVVQAATDTEEWADSQSSDPSDESVNGYFVRAILDSASKLASMSADAEKEVS